MTDAFEALKRACEATAVLQSNAAVRELDAERVQLEGAREDLTSRSAKSRRAHKVRSEAAQHRAALDLKIVSRIREDDAAIAAAAFARGLEEKLLELEICVATRAGAAGQRGASRPGIAHAVAAERAIATEGEVRRVQELNVEPRIGSDARG